MPETCGCYVDHGVIIRCNLHASATQMRELLERANNIFLVYTDATDGEGLRFSNEWRTEARALLEETQ